MNNSPQKTTDTSEQSAQKNPARNHTVPKGRFIRTRLEGREIIPYALSFVVIASIGIPVGIRSILTGQIPNPKAAMVFAIVGLISFHISVVMPSGVHINPGSPIVLGALFRYGLPTALVTIMPSFLLHFWTKKHGLLNCLFNCGQFALCLLAAEGVGLLTGWQPGIPASEADLIPILLMIFVHDTLNIFLVAIPVSIDNKEPFARTFTNMFYHERRSSVALETFLSTVSMLMSSYVDYLAPVVMLVGVMSLSIQNLFEQELVVKTQEAQTDQLTNVYNFRYLERWLETDFDALTRSRKCCSFIFADVDGLKTINDTYGHEAGDLLLAHVAEVISAHTRGRDWVARYGGDEFVISCPEADTAKATLIANRIVESIKGNPFFYHGQRVEFGLSLGVAMYPDHGETGFDVIRMADRAMYFAKKEGGNLVRTAAQL